MIRKLLGAACILVLSIGFVVADEFKGKVTKVEKDSITVKGKDGEKTFKTTGAKYFTKKGKDAKEEATAEAVKEGSGVIVDYDGDTVKSITVGGKKKAN